MNDLTPKLEKFYNEMQNYTEDDWKKIRQDVLKITLKRLINESQMPKEKIDNFRSEIKKLKHN